MKITAITIRNFKGIGEDAARIEFKPITLLFGHNSSGKSTIIQALHYAREIFERNNTDPDRILSGGDSIDLGGFNSFVHRHDLGRTISLQFDFNLSGNDLPNYRPEECSQSAPGEYYEWNILDRIQTGFVKVEIKWSHSAHRPIVSSYEVGFNGEKWGTVTIADDLKQAAITGINLEHLLCFDGIGRNENADLNPLMHEIQDDPGATIKEKVQNYRNKFGDETSEDRLLQISNLKLAELMADIRRLGIFADGHCLHIPLPSYGTALPNWNKFEISQKKYNDAGLGNYETQERINSLLSTLIVGPGVLVRDALASNCFSYLSPKREIPPRNVEYSRLPTHSRWAGGLAAWQILATCDQSFLEEVNNWMTMEDRLHTGFRVLQKHYRELDNDSALMASILSGQPANGVGPKDQGKPLRDLVLELPSKVRLYLVEEKTGMEILPQDIGIGINQMVPVVVAALSARCGITAIEQPELNIHPALQVAMGDLFICQSKTHSVTFLLETHSEHLMLRMLRRIRETSAGELPPNMPPLSPDDVAVYFIEAGDRAISITPIKVDKDGDFIDRWPQGFFGERFKELY